VVFRNKSIAILISTQMTSFAVSRTLSVSTPLARDSSVRQSLVCPKVRLVIFSRGQSHGIFLLRKVVSHLFECRSFLKMKRLCRDSLPANIRFLQTSFLGPEYHLEAVLRTASHQQVCIIFITCILSF